MVNKLNTIPIIKRNTIISTNSIAMKLFKNFLTYIFIQFKNFIVNILIYFLLDKQNIHKSAKKTFFQWTLCTMYNVGTYYINIRKNN